MSKANPKKAGTVQTQQKAAGASGKAKGKRPASPSPSPSVESDTEVEGSTEDEGIEVEEDILPDWAQYQSRSTKSRPRRQEREVIEID